jgi:hypothetical protein
MQWLAASTLPKKHVRCIFVSIPALECLQLEIECCVTETKTSRNTLRPFDSPGCRCEEEDRDRYVRVVALCQVSGEDLSAIMVREGLHGRSSGTAPITSARKDRRRPHGAVCMRTAVSRRGGGGRNNALSEPPVQICEYWTRPASRRLDKI